MSERIRQIADQVMHSDPGPHLAIDLYCFTKSEFEKFSLLIVEDCIAAVNKEALTTGDVRTTAGSVAKTLKKHFGFE